MDLLLRGTGILVILHRMPLLCRTMVRTLVAKVMVWMPFGASSTLVVAHSRRSESSLEGLLLRVRMQRRILLVPTMLISMALHGQSLLMSYARSWSLSEPYRIQAQPQEVDADDPLQSGAWRGPSLPLEAVNDGAGAVIRLRTPELPNFLHQ